MTARSSKVSRNLYFLAESTKSKWTLMCAAIHGHTLRLYTSPSDEPDSPPAHLIDMRLYNVEEVRTTAHSSKMWGRCLEVTLKDEMRDAETLPEELAASPPRFLLAAESAAAHCSWTNVLNRIPTDLFNVDADSSGSSERIGAYIAEHLDDETSRWTQVDLVPDAEVLAFLCSRQMSVVLAVEKARTHFQQSDEDMEHVVTPALSLLHDLHGAIMRADMELDEQPDELRHAFVPVSSSHASYGPGAHAASKAWLSHVQLYVVRLVGELQQLNPLLGKSADAEARCRDLISDACAKLQAIDATCQQKRHVYQLDEQSSPQGSLRIHYGVGGKRLVPYSRQRYSRYFASKVSL